MNTNHLSTQAGLTLIELLVTVAVMAVAAVLALPTIADYLQRFEARKVQHDIPALLRQARAHALTQRLRLGVCGSSAGAGCEGTWQKGLLLFVDQNQDSTLQENEPRLQFLPLNLRHGNLRWRSAAGRALIIYQADNGLPLGSNGSLIYCNSSGDQTLHRQIILSMMGHADGSRDKNGDGIHEDANGQPINCP